MPTQDKHPSHTRSAGQINPLTHQLQKAPTPQLKKSKNIQLTNLKTHQLKNLNYYLLFYNIAPNFTPF